MYGDKLIGGGLTVSLQGLRQQRASQRRAQTYRRKTAALRKRRRPRAFY